MTLSIIPPLSGTDGVVALNLGQVLCGLSHALDLTEGQPRGHCVRTCWIGMRIGGRMGLGDADLADLYYALLMKDLGCSSNAARICQLYLTDDLAFKAGFKTIDGSVGQAIAFVLKHTGPGAALTTRIRAIANVLSDAGTIVHDLIETRCHQGAEIATIMGFPPAVQQAIYSLDEHWDGGGRPVGLAGAAIPLASRIALAAQVIDVFHRQSGPDAAMTEIAGRSGRWFDPEVVKAAIACGAEPGFWDRLAAPEIDRIVFEAEPSQAGWTLTEARLDGVVEGFARVIDAKSPFTHGHSIRVALYDEMIATELGYDGADRRWMRRAALLHDIGKLGISNAILDKPDRLTEAEYAAIKRHPTMGEGILDQIDLFRPMARLAATHHERLDGAGYPRGLAAADLTTEMRILTVADIFDALTAARPYRGAMPLEQTYAIMDDMVGTAIDAEAYAALKTAVAGARDLGLS